MVNEKSLCSELNATVFCLKWPIWPKSLSRIAVYLARGLTTFGIQTESIMQAQF